MIFTSNAWGYVRAEKAFTPAEAAAHICSLGFDGFDLMIGPDATPELSLDDALDHLPEIREAAENAGGCISAIVFVGFPLHEPDVCERMLTLAPDLVRAAGTEVVNLLPRTMGISQDEGFRRLAALWQTHGKSLADKGLLVSAENHVLPCAADDDIFLLRTSADFDRMLEVTNGGLKVKYDPAWLLKGGANEDPLPAFNRLVPHIAILDLKDIRDNRFVTPGTGLIPFDEFAELAQAAGIRRIAVEVEEHHDLSPEPRDLITIDHLHREALAFYRDRLGGGLRRGDSLNLIFSRALRLRGIGCVLATR